MFCKTPGISNATDLLKRIEMNKTSRQYINLKNEKDGTFVCFGFSGCVSADSDSSLYGQRHAKKELRIYAKSVDPNQPPRLRRSV